jgi:hypothetical protein
MGYLKMRTHLTILTVMFYFLLSCTSDKSKRAEETNSQYTTTFADTLKITGEVSNSSFSTLESLTKLLIQDNYVLQIDTSFGQTVMFYPSQQDTFKVKASRLITIRAKRRNKIENVKHGNFFPGFTIQQMTFDDKEDIEGIKNRIDKIIHQIGETDWNNKNEYNYDEVLLDDRKIYYLSTKAMIFSEYVTNYYKELEKIINDR